MCKITGPSLERMPRHTLKLGNVCQEYVLKRHQSQKDTVFLMFVLTKGEVADEFVAQNERRSDFSLKQNIQDINSPSK